MMSGQKRGMMYGGMPIERMIARFENDYPIRIDVLNGVIVIEPNGWLIERQKKLRASWKASAFFPLSLTYSALEFFLHECQRLRRRRRALTKPYEGMRLIMMVNGKCVGISAIVVGAIDRAEKGYKQ